MRHLTAPTISDLTLVEFGSALARKVREHTLPREDALRILDQFDAHVEGGYYTVLPVRARDYRVARAWLARLTGSLRTLDALHLAVAAEAGAKMLTADRQLAAQAKALGLPSKLLGSK